MGDDGALRTTCELGLLAPVFFLLGLHRPELLEVVLHIEVVLIDVILPDDRVEEITGARHVAAGRCRAVALRIDVGAIRAFIDLEVAGNQHVLSPRSAPWLPVLVDEAEDGAVGKHRSGIDAHRVEQVVLDEAEHLVGFADFHRPRLQPVVLAEVFHHAAVDAGDE